MDRRKFFSVTGAGAAAAAAGSTTDASAQGRLYPAKPGEAARSVKALAPAPIGAQRPSGFATARLARRRSIPYAPRASNR